MQKGLAICIKFLKKYAERPNMRKFDYRFLEMDKIPGNMLNVLTSIYSMNAYNVNRKQDYPKIYTELEKVAVIQSVKSSNAIEGILIADERIVEIVNKIAPLKP